ncbi:transcription elongation factor, mitochondrial isoform X1 [Podarcis raffonei]|uniref:transcription elongation factor, mitochondrial isoform X1 n=1 Tax=Podarcis raffonei TaxID=65483 RepID=UPI0023295B59|nr:transcription elongation factor, mitochondrial isoform X1 [Podarcis raffonei]
MGWRGLPDLLRAGRRCFLQVPFGSPSLQPLYLLLCHKKSTYVTHLNSASAAENFKETKRAIDDLYSTEQKSTVLQLLNSASEKELSAVKLMRGRKSMNIIEYRNKHGPFRNLQCLLEVPLFQYKTAVKVCNFILNPNAKEERKEKKIQSVTSAMKYIKPDIERERLETANSIVSVVFGTRKIAWAHVNRRLAVQDWQQQECTMFMKGAYMPAVYLEEISSVISRLPEADFYVLEKSGLPALNANLFPVTLHLRTVEAMLYALLQKTFSQDGQYKVLSMARSAVGKHFELMVGDSRTSGIDLVKQFLLESVTHAEPRVNFSREQVVNYRNVLSSNKQWRDEELCDSLLQAIAFYELLILNNTT